MQEVARLEHEYVEQLRALADASVAINSSLTVEEILQLTADTARAIARARRAPRSRSSPPDPRLRPLDRDLAARASAAATPSPSRLSARAAPARGSELGMLEVVDAPRARVHARATRRSSPSSRQLASVAISNAQLYERERTIARTLQRSLRPGALPPVPGLSAAVRFRPAGEGIELGGDFYDLFAAGDGAWTALIGDVQGKGPDAAAVTALARHTMRAAAAYESRPSGVLTLLHRALREQTGDEAASAPSPTPTCGSCPATCGSSWPAAGTRCRSSCTPTAASSPVGRLGTLLGSDIEPLLDRRRRRARRAATCSCSTPTASPRCGGAAGGVRPPRAGRAAARPARGLPPDAVAERVEAAVMTASEGRLRDDMAILAFGPTPQPKETDG